MAQSSFVYNILIITFLLFHRCLLPSSVLHRNVVLISRVIKGACSICAENSFVKRDVLIVLNVDETIFDVGVHVIFKILSMYRNAHSLSIQTLSVYSTNEAICSFLSGNIHQILAFGRLLWHRLILRKHKVVIHVLEDLLVIGLFHIFELILTYNIKTSVVGLVHLFI